MLSGVIGLTGMSNIAHQGIEWEQSLECKSNRLLEMEKRGLLPKAPLSITDIAKSWIKESVDSVKDVSIS